MNFHILLLYACLCHALGYFCLKILETSTDSLLERVSLAGLIGAGIVYLVGVYTAVLGLRIGMPPFLLTLIILFLLSVILKRKIIPVGRKHEVALAERIYSRYIHWAIVIFIIFQIGYILFSGFWRPVAMNDDWAQWAGNAKYLYYYGFIDSTYFSEVNLSSYPVFIMVNEVLLCTINGHWSDFFCKSFQVVLFVDFLLYVYAWFRRQVCADIALIAPFLMVSLPIYVRIGLNGTAENVMSFYLVIYALLALQYFDSKKVSDIVVLGVVGGIISAIKAEGMFLVLAYTCCVFTLTLTRRFFSFKHVVSYCVAVLFFILPWYTLQLIGDCQSSRLGQLSLSWMLDMGSYREIIRQCLQIIIPSKVLAFLGIYFVLALLYWFIFNRNGKKTRFLLLLIGITGGVYAIGSFSTGWASQYSRLLTHSIGLLIVVIMLQVCSFTKTSKTVTMDSERTEI